MSGFASQENQSCLQITLIIFKETVSAQILKLK